MIRRIVVFRQILLRKNSSSSFGRNKTHYEILGVKNDCSHEDIKQAYFERLKEHHPDVRGGDTERSKRINVAYDVLSQADERRKYDAQIAVACWKSTPAEDPEPHYINRLLLIFAFFMLTGMAVSFVLTQRDRLSLLEDDGKGSTVKDDNVGTDIIARRAARVDRRIRERTRSLGTFDNQLQFAKRVLIKNSSDRT